MSLLNASARQVERLTPGQFLMLTPAQKADIKRTRVVAPQIGQSGFGHIEVTYKTPRYVVDAPR